MGVPVHCKFDMTSLGGYPYEKDEGAHQKRLKRTPKRNQYPVLELDMDWNFFYTNETPILRQHIIFSHMFLAQHAIRSHCCGPTETETVTGTKNALLSPKGTPL